jgi:hypothetical protein
MGLRAVARSGRPATPVSSRSPVMPARGPGSQVKADSGRSTSASTTSGWSDEFPKSTLSNCAGSLATVATG